MCFQTVALGEGLFTDGALIRSLSIVRPHVDRQVFLPRARFPANPAHKPFDAQVAPDVVGQVSFPLEKAAALRAAVRSLASVHSHVNLEFTVGHEAFAAHAADVRPLTAVRLHVSHQGAVRQEGLAADVAEERSLPDRVDLLVGLQVAGKFETLPANLATIWSFSRMSQFVAGQRS